VIFEYGQSEIEYLQRRDKKMGAAIERVGTIERSVTPDLFSALIKNIVSQQISSKAANTVWRRLCEMLTSVTPDSISNADVIDIQKCGLSMRKAGYIKGVGDAVTRGEIDISGFDSLPDEEIIRQVSSLRGVGVWTAEMLLIFSLGRPDVVSWGDLAIRRGMTKLYGLQTLTIDQFARYCRRYSPYGSVASLYLWAVSADS
jgi:DNA-3-methyladenine glycosylase II